VTTIGRYAFNKCTGVNSIEIGNSVTSIGEGVFSGCTNLTSIVIPNSVANIEVNAFQYFSGLTSIDVASDNIFYSSLAGVLYNKDKTTLIACPPSKKSVSIPNSVTSIGDNAFFSTGLTSIEIPNSVTIIGNSAFRGTGLTSIVIPNSVVSIGNSAFSNCTGLSSIICNSILPPDIGYRSFFKESSAIPLYVPDESVSAYQSATGWKDFMEIRPLSALNTKP